MNLGVIFLSETWKNMVSRHLGIDVDIAILEANDFLVKQIGILMKILEKDNVPSYTSNILCLDIHNIFKARYLYI